AIRLHGRRERRTPTLTLLVGHRADGRGDRTERPGSGGVFESLPSIPGSGRGPSAHPSSGTKPGPVAFPLRGGRVRGRMAGRQRKVGGSSPPLSAPRRTPAVSPCAVDRAPIDLLRVTTNRRRRERER